MGWRRHALFSMSAIKCAKRLGLRRLDAAVVLAHRVVPRRRQAAAVQGAFGTGIFVCDSERDQGRDSQPTVGGAPSRSESPEKMGTRARICAGSTERFDLPVFQLICAAPSDDSTKWSRG